MSTNMAMPKAKINHTRHDEQHEQHRFTDSLEELAKDGQISKLKRVYESHQLSQRVTAKGPLKSKSGAFHGQEYGLSGSADNISIIDTKTQKLASKAQGLRFVDAFYSILPKTKKSVGDRWTIAEATLQKILQQQPDDDPIRGQLQAIFEKVRKEPPFANQSPEDIAHITVSVNAQKIDEHGTVMKLKLKGRLRFSLKRSQLISVHLAGPLSLDGKRSEQGYTMTLKGQGTLSITKYFSKPGEYKSGKNPGKNSGKKSPKNSKDSKDQKPGGWKAPKKG